MKTISKEYYLEILNTQIDDINKRADTTRDDLEVLQRAYEDAKHANFNEVEVIPPQFEEEGWTFQPIYLEKN